MFMFITQFSRASSTNVSLSFSVRKIKSFFDAIQTVTSHINEHPHEITFGRHADIRFNDCEGQRNQQNWRQKLIE
jgi:hypothetical protein